MTQSGPPSHPRAGRRADGGVMPWGRGGSLGDTVRYGPGTATAHSPGASEDGDEKAPRGPGFCCSLPNRVL